MPERPQPVDWGGPPPGDGDLDELVRSLRGVDDIVTALSAGPWHAELTGETRALAEFRRVYRRPRHRRRGRTAPATWLAAAAALVVVAVGGAAAEAGRLPTPIQDLAHVVFSAPTPVHTIRPAPRPRASLGAVRSAGRPRACHDDQNKLLSGRTPWLESVYRDLAGAAGGAARVAGYCTAGDFARGTGYPVLVSGTGTVHNPATGSGGAGSGGAGSGGAGSGGASSAGTTGSGSDPASGPAHHYPGAGG